MKKFVEIMCTKGRGIPKYFMLSSILILFKQVIFRKGFFKRVVRDCAFSNDFRHQTVLASKDQNLENFQSKEYAADLIKSAMIAVENIMADYLCPARELTYSLTI